MTVRSVLTELNRQAKTDFTASSALADLPLGVRLVDRSPAFIQKALAKALDARWDGKTLVPDHALTRARDKARLDYFYAELDAAFEKITEGKFKGPRLPKHPFQFTMGADPEFKPTMPMSTEFWESISPEAWEKMGSSKRVFVYPPSEDYPYPRVDPDPEAGPHEDPSQRVPLQAPYGSTKHDILKLDAASLQYVMFALGSTPPLSQELREKILRPDLFDPVHVSYGRGWQEWSGRNDIEAIHVFSDGYPYRRMHAFQNGTRIQTWNRPLLFHEKLEGVTLAQETLKPWSIPRLAFRDWLERIHRQGTARLPDFIDLYERIPPGAEGVVSEYVRIIQPLGLNNESFVGRFIAALAPRNREQLFNGGTVTRNMLTPEEQTRIELIYAALGGMRLPDEFWQKLAARLTEKRTPWVFGTGSEGGRLSMSQEDFQKYAMPAGEIEFCERVEYNLFTHGGTQSRGEWQHEDILLIRK